jgi:hypothetical protein
MFKRIKPMTHLRPFHMSFQKDISYVRYQAQSALMGMIEDRGYLPTFKEAKAILAWADRRGK